MLMVKLLDMALDALLFFLLYNSNSTSPLCNSRTYRVYQQVTATLLEGDWRFYPSWDVNRKSRFSCRLGNGWSIIWDYLDDQHLWFMCSRELSFYAKLTLITWWILQYRWPNRDLVNGPNEYLLWNILTEFKIIHIY